MYPLSDKNFSFISRSVYEYAKINLTDKKRTLVISRLSNRIRSLNLTSFTEYISYIKNDITGEEFLKMVDSLSTNYSLFFREQHHFDFMSKTFLPAYRGNQLNIWSAASSSGQEIFSISMTIKEYEKQNNKKIKHSLYASDLSRTVLQTASRGIFEHNDVNKLEKKIIEQYFLKGRGEQKNKVKVKKEILSEITFFRLNLNDDSYKLPSMDIIFLRNVIIYFDIQTKMELMKKIHSCLKPGGYLILGHSESLSGISNDFRLLGQTIYKRID